MATITAANSILMLSVRGLFPVPQRIVGYTADAAFSSDSVQPSETVMGVDGRMSAGYVPYTSSFTVNIMPDSESNAFFDAWLAAQKAAREVYYCDGAVTLPSIGTSYILTRGVITAIQVMPGVQRVLQARPFGLTFQSIDAVPV